MDGRFRLKPYCSKFIMILRITDALIVPAILLILLRLHHVHVGERITLLAAMAALLTALSMEAVGLYRRWRGAQLRREIHTILAGWGLVVAGVLLASIPSKALYGVPTNVFVSWLILAPAGLALAHASGRAFLRWARVRGYNHRSAVIAGAGDIGMALAEKLTSVPWAGINVRAFFDDDPQKHGTLRNGVRVEGSLDELVPFVKEHRIDIVYLALPMRAEKRMRSLMEALNQTNASVYMVPDVFVFDLLGAQILDIDGMPVVSLSESPQIGPAGVIKRMEDLILATTGLILLSPLFLVIAILIKKASPGPVFFGHTRIGRNGRKFKCYKFRTMVVNADQVLKELLERDPEARKEWEENFKLKNDPRITRIGRFLRKTSLDELPQLWNVIKGDMSLVGPRPIVEAEIPKYGRYYRHLAKVRPGMTGLWQISGRNDVTYEERVRMDVEYAKNWSVWRDLIILGKTVKVVLAKTGSY